MKKLKDILNGYVNLIKNKLNLSSEEIENLSKKRLDICNICPKYLSKIGTCDVCGCYMPSKSRVRDAQCPENFW